jgi:hypothetical protein
VADELRPRRVKYRFHSLDEYLISAPLTVDGQLDDGWGAPFPVKGRELEATILFADITSFSSRTLQLTPTETLAYVNNFFAWISAEALRHGHGVVDKYIGDEIMVVFARDFGSDDPFRDAVQTARFMAENDAHSFVPHIGIASGQVVIGYVGTPLKYNCSVFGAPVALAARCASVKGDPPDAGSYSTKIVFPANEWSDRELDEVFRPTKYREPDGSTFEQPHSWELFDPRPVEMKNLPDTIIREIVRRSINFPSQGPEDRAREGVAELERHGLYRPRLKRAAD